MSDSIRFIEINKRKFGQLLNYKTVSRGKLKSSMQSGLVGELRADLQKSMNNLAWMNLSYIQYLQEFTDLPLRKEEYSAIINLTDILLEECEDQLKDQKSINLVESEELLDLYFFKCTSQFSDSWYLRPKVSLPINIGKALLVYDPSLYKTLFDTEHLHPFRLTAEEEPSYEYIDEPTVYYFIGAEVTNQIHSFLSQERSKSKTNDYFFKMFSRAQNGESIIIVDI